MALAGVVVTLSTRTVEADALLPRPSATAPPAVPIDGPTPASLGPRKHAGIEAADLLHGLASWYGGVFNGRKTASGERFDMNSLTACHPTLPFGTMVRVVNRNNHKSVDVRITDRGYLYKGRIIDLSYAAAEKLSMTRSGVAPVDITVISESRRHRRK